MTEWITIASYRNRTGRPTPTATVHARLRDRGIDWMPFPPEAIRWDAPCGIGPDGHWQCWFDVRVDADALRPLGLHPEQPTATVNGPSPPRWWHAEAQRPARG